MEESTFIYRSSQELDTLRLGQRLGELLQPGQIVLLSGDLGAGKTVLARGIADGLGVRTAVTSPTYKLINEYEGETPLYHMDLYRLEQPEELIDLGFEEYLERDGVVVIEWPELAYDLLPGDYLLIKIKIVDRTGRDLRLMAAGEQGKKLIARLKRYVSDGY